MSSSYSNKNDFDDMNVYHQTKSTFKNEKQGLVKMQNSRRSTFIDCFTGDSIEAPATICPEGVNSTTNFPCIDESTARRINKDPKIIEADKRVVEAEKIANSAKDRLMQAQNIQNELYKNLNRPKRPHDRNPISEKILKIKHERAAANVADLIRSYNTEQMELEKAKVLAANSRMAAFRSGNCPSNTKWNSDNQTCESVGNRAGILNHNKRELLQNRKRSFFNSIVE